MSVLIGYARVSKADGSQSLDLQRDALIAAGVDASRIYEDRASGRKDARPGLQECLRALQPGNTLVIWKLDRLGRDLKHLINTVDDLRERDIGFRVLAGYGASIDTTTHNGRLFFGVFAVLAEYERELIAERTKAGLAAARARGRKGGRPRKMSRKTIEAAQALLRLPNETAQGVADHLNISTATLYSYLNGDGSLKEEGAKVMESPNQSEHLTSDRSKRVRRSRHL
ncbi:recombinase family protein [Notoacmeibacter sp. MSK16QG-6]|uniref:recombinase family protein n=1 Tax=Notoacmeibacter sp. MSK16QG-6 TaxID=2957982 RepID=UPI00209DB922|nr:recombinase family protein [Notoacmeibacter sp. MSK16QG-6]MCP1201086.1 recombinase family protein [Notoacmeibacter sp. MSK16QG-6]